MAKSISKLLAELDRLEASRRATFEELARADALLLGSLGVVRRTCGKSNCHCADKESPGHPTTVLMSAQADGRRCQVVRVTDVERLQGLVDRYRRFREGLRALKHLETELHDLLKELMRLRNAGYS